MKDSFGRCGGCTAGSGYENVCVCYLSAPEISCFLIRFGLGERQPISLTLTGMPFAGMLPTPTPEMMNSWLRETIFKENISASYSIHL